MGILCFFVFIKTVSLLRIIKLKTFVMNYKHFFTIIAIAAMCITLFYTCKKDEKGKKGKKGDPGVTFEWEPEMVYVEPGTFTMGCTDDDCIIDRELPAHQVTLTKGYYIGKYQVTQAQWKAVMGNNPSDAQGDDLPVEMVSWYDVQTFIAKLNKLTGKKYRLPTEAEWEYAGRGGLQSDHYKYSGSNNINDVAWYGAYSGGNSGDATHAVGLKHPNELGIYDMSGNVYEWCSDWYGVYSDEAQTDPQGPTVGSNHVIRGGSFVYSAQCCRVAYRSQCPNFNAYYNLGFRVARSE
jgi:formylglycine-generating enzyme required for sulfatase activity